MSDKYIYRMPQAEFIKRQIETWIKLQTESGTVLDRGLLFNLKTAIACLERATTGHTDADK